jgi:hypothetical protein
MTSINVRKQYNMLCTTIMSSSDQVKYLRSLHKQLKEKNLESFWVMADRSRFKPMKETKDAKIEKYLKTHASRYGNRPIATVTLFVDKDEIKNNGYVFRLKVIVFDIHEDGSIATKRGDNWGYKINYTLDNLYKNKFTLSFMYKVVKAVAQNLIKGDDFIGTSFKNFVHEIQRKNIDLDEL